MAKIEVKKEVKKAEIKIPAKPKPILKAEPKVEIKVESKAQIYRISVTGTSTTWESTIALGDRTARIQCKNGIIETEDKALADFLLSQAGYERK